GHTDAIHALTVANNGKLLASGGSDGIQLWDMITLEQLMFLQPQHGMWGPVSCIAWVCRNLDQELLCYGTGLGYLVYYSQTAKDFEELWCKCVGTGFEVTCVTSDASGRIAIGTCDRIVQVWSIDATEVLCPVFSVQLDTTVPKTLGFVHNTAKDPYIFGLYNRQCSRHTVISMKRNQFVVDNATDGFDLHQLDNGAHICTLPTGTPTKKVPKQVAFREDWEIIVGGSDHGLVYLFEREMGRLLNVLRHVDKGLVQTI
ncbi:WD40 repeat-like protein, partial [Ramaria rubella]